jgi:hypothetical protein
MDQDPGIPLRDCIRASAKMIAGQLETLTDVAVSLGCITTELQELNRNLYDIDNRLLGIIAKLEEQNN